MINRKSRIFTLVFVTFLSTASAQTPIRDTDQEARNAYQETCSITSSLNDAFCSLPPLPEGKRLALRELNMSCTENSSRVLGGEVFFKLSSQFRDEFYRFRALQSGHNGIRFLTVPLYGHSDFRPVVFLHLNPNQIATTSCDVSIHGYLVNKP